MVEIIYPLIPHVLGYYPSNHFEIKYYLLLSVLFDRCEVAVDRCQQPVSDALMFHLPNVLANSFIGFPHNHPPWQIWIVSTMESEVNYESTKDLNGKFNWTISHRYFFFTNFKSTKMICSCNIT